MKAKTFIIILVLAVVLFAIYKFVDKSSSMFTPTGTSSDSKGLPSISDLMAKGYDLEEANSILKSLEAGSDINY